jgi:DNA-binding XRE family transcriptional regulator
MSRKHRFESDALQYTFDRFIGDNPKRLLEWEEAGANLDIAMMIYELRKKARLTQSALAQRVGTTASSISRLEDADYEGHSLAMLRRIAGVLGKRVEVRLVDDSRAGERRPARNGKRKSVA